MLEDLTFREREIFYFLVQRVSPKEIAHRLNISYTTVSFHRANLYKKLKVHSVRELHAKYSANGNVIPLEPLAEPSVYVSDKDRKSSALFAVEPIGTIIPANNLGFFSWTDRFEGGNSTCEIFITSEIIDGAVFSNVLNIKINLVKRENSVTVYASANTKREDLIQRLRQASGIRFKVRGDGKMWFVEFLTEETTRERNYARYSFVFGTVRNRVVVVDVPYSRLTLPGWYEQYSFDFNKETIREMIFSQAINIQEYGSFSLQIFDFEIY